MAILNKTNTIEIIFIILMATFILTLVSLVILEDFGYIQTTAGNCNNYCLQNNMTGKYDNDVCRCCAKSTTYDIVSKSTIDEQCYEVIINSS